MLSKSDLEKAILLAQAESYSIMKGFLEAWNDEEVSYGTGNWDNENRDGFEFIQEGTREIQTQEGLR